MLSQQLRFHNFRLKPFLPQDESQHTQVQRLQPSPVVVSRVFPGRLASFSKGVAVQHVLHHPAAISGLHLLFEFAGRWTSSLWKLDFSVDVHSMHGRSFASEVSLLPAGLLQQGDHHRRVVASRVANLFLSKRHGGRSCHCTMVNSNSRHQFLHINDWDIFFGRWWWGFCFTVFCWPRVVQQRRCVVDQALIWHNFTVVSSLWHNYARRMQAVDSGWCLIVLITLIVCSYQPNYQFWIVLLGITKCPPNHFLGCFGIMFFVRS